MLEAAGIRRYVILDRDGTVIFERRYLCDPEGVELLPGALEGMRGMAALGLGLVLVTNQAGIGRGYYDEARYERVNERLVSLLAQGGVVLDGVYHCPHAPDQRCDCRKPAPGMVDRAAADLGFDPGQSVVIGDKPCDINLGKAVGATTLLVRTGYGTEVERDRTAQPDHVVDDLVAAVPIIRDLHHG